MCKITDVLPLAVVSSVDGCVSTVVRTDYGTDHFVRYNPAHKNAAIGQSLADYWYMQHTTLASTCPVCGAPLHNTRESTHCYNFVCPARMTDIFYRQLALLGMTPPHSVAGYTPYLLAYLNDTSPYSMLLQQRLRELLTFARLIPFLGLGHLMSEPLLDQPHIAAMPFVEFARRMRMGDTYYAHADHDFKSALALAWSVNRPTLDRVETICLTQCDKPR